MITDGRCKHLKHPESCLAIASSRSSSLQDGQTSEQAEHQASTALHRLHCSCRTRQPTAGSTAAAHLLAVLCFAVVTLGRIDRLIGCSRILWPRRAWQCRHCRAAALRQCRLSDAVPPDGAAEALLLRLYQR